ncbi:MAG: Holliday junction resolvase RuvX [Planctomyces sp.]|nr:Holliday junction resolvase RuvX [Planctomyces sp.]MBA4120510.1 Holliday junction resolvase RuvX [Isosphaera sp.]
MRLMAIDLGDKRTGLAVGDTVTGLVSPAGALLVPIARRGGADLLGAIAQAVDRHGPARLVVGLPLNMDGTEGPRAKAVRAFAQRLASATGLEVDLRDERLTSADADWAMARSGLTHGQKKSRRDALAAAAILRDHLATLGACAQPDRPQTRPIQADPPDSRIDTPA